MVEENIEKKTVLNTDRFDIQNFSLEDYVVTNMVKIIDIYKNTHLSLPILRLTSKIHWLDSIKEIISLVFSHTSGSVSI